jgi:hypothetical protein
MQKVEGSSPFIRCKEAPLRRGFWSPSQQQAHAPAMSRADYAYGSVTVGKQIVRVLSS